MTVYTLVAGTPSLPLEGGYFLRLEAIDPATGLAVTGVSVNDVAVYGRSNRRLDLELEDVLPTWIPDEVVEGVA